MRTMAENGLMAADRYEEITAAARALVERGEGRELMIVPGWWYVISAQTYVEFLDNCPDIIEMAGRVPCETLFVRSVEEPPDLYPAEEFAAHSRQPVDIRIIEAGGHYYLGEERLVTDTVADWLASRV